MAEGQYKFSIGLDNEQLELDIQQAKKAFDSLVKQAKKAGAVFDDIPNPFDSIGKSAPKVEAAKKQFDALGMSVAQLARETPALAMSVNTYIMAISNNLPIFADAVKKVREENAALAAQGKPTVSVLKQIGSALISWQTLLIAAVTTLAMNGDKVWAWVKSLFSAKDALDDVARAEKALQDVRTQGTIAAQEEVAKIRLTAKVMQDTTALYTERLNALQALKNEYPEYFAKLTTEEMLNGKAADSVQELIDKTIALAQARKAFNQLVENEENMRLLEGTEGYSAYRNQLGLFKGSGHGKYERYEKIYHPSGITVGGRWVETDDERYNSNKSDAYKAVEKAQKDFLENLKNGNKEQKAIYEQIVDEYDGNIEAYLEALDESNKKLTESAQGAVTDPGLKAAEAEEKRLEQEAERIRKQAVDATVKLAKDAVDARTEAIISAMDEGLTKEKAQINAEYDAKARDITKREEELKKLQGGKLTERQTVDFASLRASNEEMRANAIADAEEKATKKAKQARDEALEDLADYYTQYGTIQEKILYATEKYAALIANAKTEGERMSLEAERDALLTEYQVAASEWAGELVDKTTIELNKMLADLKAQVDAKQAIFDKMDTSNSEEAKNYQKQITELTAKIAYLQSLLNKAGKSANDNNWAEVTQVFQSIASSANEAAEGIASFDESTAIALRTIAKLAGVATNISASIKGLGEAFEETGKKVMALEKASAVLAVISAVIQAISFIANSFNENAEATRNAAEALSEYESALKRIKNAEIGASYSNIFGTDTYGEFNARLKAAQEYSKALDDIRAKAEKEVDYGWYRSRKEQANFDLRTQAGGVYDNTKFIADMRSGWQKFWGSDKNIKTTSLDEFYENGVLNVDKLKAYYDTYKEYLTSEQQLLIEELISNGELLQENLDAINGYLQDKFGQMGQTISDALVDAFENGTDAAEAMGKAVSDVLEDIAEDIAYSSFIQPLLDNANKQIDELNKQRQRGEVTEEEFFNQLVTIGTQLMAQVEGSEEAYLDYLDALKQAADERGVKLFGGDDYSVSASSKGFQTMSQETGSELNGRFTDIQGQTHRIAEAVEFNKGMQQQQTMYLQSVSETLAAIHTNTDSIEKHTRALANIESDINAMRRTMDNGGSY